MVSVQTQAGSPAVVQPRLPFPTGDWIRSRPDLAATLRDNQRIAQAVVITDDARVYAALQLFPGQRLTEALTTEVQRTLQRYTGAAPQNVFVTATASAYADFAGFAR
ncbi:MAG: hypothetical protein K6T31_01230 [Alicyclobacillus sp.]|nr:hypothetical protein [Alicyclobacillus sp.]